MAMRVGVGFDGRTLKVETVESSLNQETLSSQADTWSSVLCSLGW